MDILHDGCEDGVLNAGHGRCAAFCAFMNFSPLCRTTGHTEPRANRGPPTAARDSPIRSGPGGRPTPAPSSTPGPSRSAASPPPQKAAAQPPPPPPPLPPPPGETPATWRAEAAAPRLPAPPGADAPSSSRASAAPTPSPVVSGGGGSAKARSEQAELPLGDGAVGRVEGSSTRSADHSGSPGDDGGENAADGRGGTRSGSGRRRQGGGGLVGPPYWRRADGTLAPIK